MPGPILLLRLFYTAEIKATRTQFRKLIDLMIDLYWQAIYPLFNQYNSFHFHLVTN